jgi:hypothetical protein
MKDLLKRVVGLKEKARLTEVFDKNPAKHCSNNMLHF